MSELEFEHRTTAHPQAISYPLSTYYLFILGKNLVEAESLSSFCRLI